MLIDPDKGFKGPEHQENIEMEFESALDMYEYELNKEDVFLTDGFYSSVEDDQSEVVGSERPGKLPDEFYSQS